jgi:hypothetical protein
MKCKRIIGEKPGYWNIKGWGHSVAFFRVNCLRFMRFAAGYFKKLVAPP